MRSRYGVTISNLLHPTDFSHGSRVAFAHALRIAVDLKGQLEILHVDHDESRADWKSYPPVRETLAEWGLLSQDAQRGDVARLGVNISKSASKGNAPAEGILKHIERRGAGLVVMATHQRDGFDRWLQRNLAETISNRAEAASLFVPYGVDGFVNPGSGEVTLRKILIPVDKVPDPQSIVDVVADLVNGIATEDVEIRLLHVGDPAGMPSPTLPNSEKCRWVWETKVGGVVEAILEDAEMNDVDLIAMTTNGHDGFLDAIRGSTTERVLHRSRCPVLSIHSEEE